MREGSNPGKTHSELPPFKQHRVLVPVFIPSHEGYFRHALEILKLSLESLCVTTANRANVTIISNGCAVEVVRMLEGYLELGRIDQLLLNHGNRGKIDAVLSVAHGCFEDLITISDCDVLFMPGWLAAVEDVFQAFPECGVVAPVPNPSLAYHDTASTILGALIRRELRLEKVVPEADLDRFAHSIGRPDYFEPEQRWAQLVVRRNGNGACVGAGHFVFTLRREVADDLPRHPSLLALQGETEWLDDPPEAMGVWRLATTRAYAYHLGNLPEPWMYEALDWCQRQSHGVAEGRRPLPPLKRSGWARLPLRWRAKGLAAVRKFHLQRRWSKVRPVTDPLLPPSL